MRGDAHAPLLPLSRSYDPALRWEGRIPGGGTPSRFESEDLLALELSSNTTLARHEHGVNCQLSKPPPRGYWLHMFIRLVRMGSACLAVILGELLFIHPVPVTAEPLDSTEAISPTQTIVVAPNRVATPHHKVASSTTVVTAAEIERKQLRTVSDVLRSVPGVDVVRSGGAGGNTVVFIRGANSEHTLVLIDGVEANNPITPNRAFNFADLSTENIERIEIVRGAQSTLYGSDALGGVINIVTRRGRGPTHGELSVEGGSYTSFTERAAVRGGNEAFDYSLGISRIDAGGISAADAGDGNNEHDRYGLSVFSARIDGRPNDQVELSATARFEGGRSDIDNGGGVGADDPNRRVRNENLFTRGQAAFELFNGALEQTWGVGYSAQRFDDDNDPDPRHPNDRLRSNYDGDRIKFDVQNNVRLTDDTLFLLGLETEEEQGSSGFRSVSDFGPFDSFLAEQTARTSGAYGQVLTSLGTAFSSSLGLRVDDHDEFGSEVTWRIAPTYTFADVGTKVSATVGTGYKAPSLFQLYSEYGFIDLEPEESFSLDASLEQSVSDDVLIGVTWYRNDFDNLITFDPNTFIFANIAAATTQGFETFVDAELGEEVSARASYTYLDSEDQTTNAALLRRARHKATLDVRFEPYDRLAATVSGVLTGVRDDNDFSTFPASRVTLPSFVTVNLAVQYGITEGTTLFARVENIFDREYQDVLGYGALGAAGYAGLKVLF